MRFFSILFVAAVSFSVFGAPSSKTHFVEISGKHRFEVDVVQTPSEWAKGLMYRERLAPNQGMLFVGKTEKPQAFWMKNTLISLDIIFISKDWKIVSIQEKTAPLSEEPLPSAAPAMHVLEVPGGRSQALGIKAGDSVKWIRPH